MVLEHPLQKRLSLYGMNGGTCRVLPREAWLTSSDLSNQRKADAVAEIFWTVIDMSTLW